ncbi:hypothetical protein C8R44DRAFT_904167 [Mycena epipterygia]|nr:hypothetical protein C8R44DRAFT_904167 [Mycena epipterygia]
MPHQHTVSEIRVKTIIECLTPMVTLLDEVTSAFGTPFLQAISSTTLSLINAVQNVKRNKDECIRLMENIHKILYTIINLHITSETRESLPPAILDHIGKFTETLHKIYTFIEAQQDRNKIKYFFHQNEMNTLQKNCQAGLEETLKVFAIETGLTIANNMAEMQKKIQNMHQELLELVETLSDGSTSDSSLSPKIFYGREQQLEEIVVNLTQESAHIAILGAGGIGKTSLARAALHHPDVSAKYEHRFFVAADSATTGIELAALTGSHLGLKSGKDLTKAIVRFLSTTPSSLLVLDNLETPWEPLESRGGVEEFLSLLTGIPHLALIITMRGAERPAKVRWTRPFLEPLKPLSYDAARQTFIEIADNFHDPKEIDQLLCLTNNMPLAVDLIAHLVDYEGCSNVLARWKTEKTSLLSTGYDRQSSLDASIIMSLASPRLTPGAKDLLSLLSILPDGLSDSELVQSNLPIQDLLGCRATLLRTSLAYSDDTQRLKSLVPIREHTHTFSPPSQPLFHPLCKYFQSVIDLYEKYRGTQLNTTRIHQITANLGKLHQLLLLEFHVNSAEVVDAINCTLSLNSFHRLTGHSHTALMDDIPAVFPQPCDHQLEARYVTETLYTMQHYPVANPESLIQKGMAHFHHINDLVLEARFYTAVGNYSYYSNGDFTISQQSFEKALSLAKTCEDSRQQAIALERLSELKWSMGDSCAALMHAREAQQIAQLSANLYHEALSVEAEAGCLMALGDLKQSVLLCQRARELLQLCGMHGGRGEHSVMNILAEVHRLKSEYLEACSIHIELAQNAPAHQDPLYNAYDLLNIAELDVMVGVDALEVQHNLDNAKAIFSIFGLPRLVNQCETTLADLHLREGNEMVARPSFFQKCLDAVWRNDNQVMSYCLERLADIGRWTSTNDNPSYRWPVIYVLHAQKTQEKLAVYKALRFLGDVFLSERDEHTAHNLFVVALEAFTYMDIHRSRADCMLRLGDIEKNRGDSVKAAELWRGARPLFERSSQAKDVAKIDTRLALVEQEIPDAHQRSLGLLSELEASAMSVDEPSIVNDIQNIQGEAILEN